jgi:hypothetical protein
MERAAKAHEANLAACGQVNQQQRPTVETLGNTLSATNGCGPPKVMVALSGSAAETLRCLFFHGPTWDGNVPSQTGRDELVNMRLAARGNGWQWLTLAGIDACFANGIHDEKDRRESRESQRRVRLEDAARQFLGS